MNAGELRHRISFYEPVTTDNAHGQPVETGRRRIAGPLRAKVVQLSGRELWRQQQMQSDVTFRVELRWLEGITAAMFVIWQDGNTERRLNLAGPPLNPDGKKIQMILECIEAQ